MVNTPLVFITQMQTLKPEKQPKQLKDNERQLVDLILQGKSQADAYIQARKKDANYSRQSAQVCAYKILNKPKVKEYLSTVRKKAQKKSFLNIEERAIILTEIATDIESFPSDKIRAIQALGDLLGDVGPQKIEISTNLHSNSSKPLTVRDKIRLLRQAREDRKKNETIEEPKHENVQTEPKTEKEVKTEETGGTSLPRISPSQTDHAIIEIESTSYISTINEEKATKND